MEKVLNKEFGLTGRFRVGILIVVALFLVVSFFVYGRLNDNITQVIISDAERNVANISELNAEAVRNELLNRQTLLDSIADSLLSGHEYRVDAILPKMRFYSRNYNFYSMGILTTDGILHTVDGEEKYVGDIDIYRRAMEGESLISESIMSLAGEWYVNVVTAPVYNKGSVQYILAGAYRSGILARSLNTSALDGKGYTFILNSKGNVVIYAENGVNEEYLSLLEHVDRSKDIVPRADEDSTFEYKGNTYYAHFEPLGINDWYLLICADEDDVFAGANVIINSVLTGMGFLWAVIILSLVYVVLLWIRYQKKTNKIVFEDRLLKEKNYEFLRIKFPQITKEERRNMVLFVLDIDKFKEFNYIYGSESGDALLKYINRTFKEALPQDQIYRNTADQFTGLLLCADRGGAEEKINRLLARFRQDIADKKVQAFTVSVGMSMLKDYDELQIAYSDALIAKNTVKGDHVRKQAFYDEKMRRERLEYAEMESSFIEAVRNNEFQVYYQPKIDSRTGKIIGAEALVRWIRPDGTIIPPSKFIPCFEANRQVVILDEAVIENVCRYIGEMGSRINNIVPISVNLSRVHLRYPGIAERIAEMMEEMGIDADKLAFEITESTLYEDTIWWTASIPWDAG